MQQHNSGELRVLVLKALLNHALKGFIFSAQLRTLTAYIIQPAEKADLVHERVTNVTDV